MIRARIGFSLLCASAFLMDCSGRMQASDEELGIDRAAAVTAAGSILGTQVVNGVAIGGETPGNFSVTDSGQASYEVPLWTPAGVAGVEPSLALRYDSGAGSGPLGIGWSLTGMPISRITRCGKTIAVDSNSGPIDFSGNTYCLDGKRLISVGSNEYRTEEDEFSKIVITAGTTTNPQTFKVFRKNGLVLTYGSTSSSRLSGTRKPTTCRDASNLCREQTFVQTTPAPPPVTLAWAVDRVADRAGSISGATYNNIGNYMTIAYQTWSEELTPRYTAGDFTFKEMQIQEIQYGFGMSGTPARRKVVFTYNQIRDDARFAFVSGLPIQSKRLLTQIDVSGPNPTPTTVPTTLLRQYRLNYEKGTISKRSRLRTVQECDGLLVCKTPTTFMWENGSNQYLHVPDTTTRVLHPSAPMSVVDYNADGKDDLFIRYATHPFDTLQVSEQRILKSMIGLGGATSGAPVSEEHVLPTADSTHWIFSVQGVDIDGDTRTDFAMPSSPGTGRPVPPNEASRKISVDLLRNSGNTFFYFSDPEFPNGLPPELPYPPLVTAFFADLDGNGTLDELEPGAVAFTGHNQLMFRRNAGGMSGLGTRQLLTESNKKYGIQTRTQYWKVGPGNLPDDFISYDGYETQVADIDGSGRKALLTRDAFTDAQGSASTSDEMRAFYLTSSQTTPVQTTFTTLRAYARTAASTHYIMMDVNGDGLADAIEVPNTKDGVADTKGIRATDEAPNGIPYVRVNTGAGFKRGFAVDAAVPGTNYGVNMRQDAGVVVADLNQDGAPDLVLLGKTIQNSGADGRTTVQVILGTTGTSGGYHLTKADATTTPLGCEPNNGPCTPIPAAPPLYGTVSNPYGAIAARVGDFNGDGLADIVVALPFQPLDTRSVLHFYINKGRKADQLVSIDTALGSHIGIEYASVSDPAVYRRTRRGHPFPGTGGETWEMPAECRYPLSCVAGGMWVVSRYSITNDKQLPNLRTMQYAEGRNDALRGWLGFAERYQTDQTTGRLTVTTYDNITKTNLGVYPYAFLPASVGTIVRGISSGSSKAHRNLTTHNYETSLHAVSSVFSVRTKATDSAESVREDDPTMSLEDLVFLDANQYDTLHGDTTQYTYDSFNNITNKRVETPTFFGPHLSETVTTYLTPDTNNWLVNLVAQQTETSTTPFGDQARRFTSFTYEPLTNLVKTESIEPGGTNDVKSLIGYTRGPGAAGQVTLKTTTANLTPDDVGSPQTRTEATAYDSVDAVYPASTTNGLGHKTLLAFHPGLGVLAQTEDPNRVITKFQYDGFARLRTRSEPSEGDITMDYENSPAVATLPSVVRPIYPGLSPKFALRTKQVGGGESLVTYNANGREVLRQTKAGDGQYRFVLTRYKDVPGQVGDVSRPFTSGDSSFSSTFFTYDALGREIQTSLPDGATVRRSYTPRNGQRGWIVGTIDARGFLHEEEKDELGRVVSKTDYLNGIPSSTSYTYGPFNRLTAIGPPSVVTPGPAGGTKSASTGMTYDTLGRRVQVNDSDSGTNVNSYNAFGDIVKQRDSFDPAVPAVSYLRDALGRIQERRSAEGTTTYTWDTAANGIGKLASSRTPDGTTTTFTYDTAGRPKSRTYSIKGRSYTVGLGYETTTSRRLSRMDYPATIGTTALAVTYGYDQAGQLSRVSKLNAVTPYWRATAWDRAGNISQEQDATGMVTTRTYNPARAWLDKIVTKTSASTIQDVSYTHDANGNITYRNDQSTGAVTTTEVFEYNEMNQLDKWIFSAGVGTSTTWTTDYAAQASGVIQQTKTGPGAQSMAYNYFGNLTSALPHAVRSIQSGCTPTGICYTPSYNTRGNMTNTVTGLTVGYTSSDLPQTIYDVNGNPAAVFTYDATDTRVFKDVTKTNGHQTTAYVGGVYERRVSPTGVVSHVMYIRNGSRAVAQETWTESGSSISASPVLYLHDDTVGSIAVTNSTAATTRLRYDPFGLRISATNPTQAPATIPTTIGFTGHEMDDEWNYINMKGRLYDAKIARFLTPDPVLLAPHFSNSYDRYGYALNNPMTYTDPSGLMIPISDIYMAQWGYGDAIGFFREYRALSEINGRMRHLDGKAQREAAERAKAERGEIDADNTEEQTWRVQVGGVKVRIVGGTAEQRFNTYMYLVAVLGTKNGAEIMKKLEKDPRWFDILIINRKDTSSYRLTDGHGIALNMNDMASFYKSGNEKFFYTEIRAIAHELGHYMGAHDSPYLKEGQRPYPGSEMDNVWAWENPIASELGDKDRRTQYRPNW